jgi:hypothetical protein
MHKLLKDQQMHFGCKDVIVLHNGHHFSTDVGIFRVMITRLKIKYIMCSALCSPPWICVLDWLQGNRHAVTSHPQNKGHSCNCCRKFRGICTALSEGIATVNTGKLAEADLCMMFTHTHTQLYVLVCFTDQSDQPAVNISLWMITTC